MTAIPIANPGDASVDSDYKRPACFLFFFGPYDCRGSVYCYGNLEDALETAAEWCVDNRPGELVQPDYECEARERGLAWPPAQGVDVWDESDPASAPYREVIESAEADLTYTESGYLVSHEWTIREIDPSSREGRLLSMRVALALDLEYESGDSIAVCDKCGGPTTLDRDVKACQLTYDGASVSFCENDPRWGE